MHICFTDFNYCSKPVHLIHQTPLIPRSYAIKKNRHMLIYVSKNNSWILLPKLQQEKLSWSKLIITVKKFRPLLAKFLENCNHLTSYHPSIDQQTSETIDQRNTITNPNPKRIWRLSKTKLIATDKSSQSDYIPRI